jgi:5'-3' exonuclease
MRLLIDLDNILFRILLATKDYNYYSQLRAVDFKIDSVLDKFNTNSARLILSGSGNFRKVIYPDYKGNRKDVERPRYLSDARNYCIKYWNAEVADLREADDLIGELHGEDTIAVVYDKDYLQLGGKFYDPWNDKLYEVDNPEYHFWKQVLTGCRSDSVPGCPNPAKLHHKKPPCFSEDTACQLLTNSANYKETVKDQYMQVYGEGWYEVFDRNCKLIFLHRPTTRNYYEIY